MPTTFFGWVAFLLEKYGMMFLQGAGVTLIISITGTVLGFMLGLLVAVIRTIPIEPGDNIAKKILLRLVRIIMTVYIDVFRGTPMMVQSMVLYYGYVMLTNTRPNIILAGIIIVSVNTGAYMAEIIRGGIISIDKGQTEGSLSVGMTHWQTMINVVLPQAIRNILPSIGNEFVVNIKDSCVLNVISVSELFFMAKSAAGTYLHYFETYFIIGVIYLILTTTVTRILKLIEKKMDGPQNFDILGSQSDIAETISLNKRNKKNRG